MASSTPFRVRVVPYCRLAHLEISQILKFLTTFSRTSLPNPSSVSIVTNSAAATYLHLLSCLGGFKDAPWSTVAIPPEHMLRCFESLPSGPSPQGS